MAKQTTIPGTEEKPEPEIERALAAWEDAQEEAAKYKTTADRRRDELIAKMQAKKVEKYKSKKRGKTVWIELNTKLKKAKLHAEDLEDEDDDEEDGEE